MITLIKSLRNVSIHYVGYALFSKDTGLYFLFGQIIASRKFRDNTVLII